MSEILPNWFIMGVLQGIFVLTLIELASLVGTRHAGKDLSLRASVLVIILAATAYAAYRIISETLQ